MGGYLRFRPTASPLVNAILNAIESAGDGYHHTSDWNEATSNGPGSHIDEIQEAAKVAASELDRLRKRVEVLEHLL